MALTVEAAVPRVLQGESIASVAAAYREDLLDSVGLRPDEARATTFRKETTRFVNRLCRELGDRHTGDRRAALALREWVEQSREYECWDALLAGFEFEGRARLVERGRVLFPRTLTAHW
jgi:hypothetical protein